MSMRRKRKKHCVGRTVDRSVPLRAPAIPRMRDIGCFRGVDGTAAATRTTDTFFFRPWGSQKHLIGMPPPSPEVVWKPRSRPAGHKRPRQSGPTRPTRKRPGNDQETTWKRPGNDLETTRKRPGNDRERLQSGDLDGSDPGQHKIRHLHDKCFVPRTRHRKALT